MGFLRGFWWSVRAGRKPPLTVVSRNPAFSSKIWALIRWFCLALKTDCSLGIRERQPDGGQINQTAGSVEYLAATLCPRAADPAHRGIPTGAARRGTAGPGLLYRRYRA